MRNIGVISLVLIGILVIACGSSGSSEPTGSGLRERAEAFATAFSNEEWVEIYRFYSPEYQENCSAEAFASGMELGLGMLKAVRDIDEGEKIGIRITAVTVDGLNGTVRAVLLYKSDTFSDPMDRDETSEQWSFIDGQWRYDEDDGCLTADLS